MDNIEKLLYQILESQNATNEQLKRIEQKIDSTHDQVFRNSEAITSLAMKSEKIIDDIEYLKHKEHQTEEDLFKLKKNLQIVK